MSEEFQIRPVQESDYQEWLKLWEGPQSYLEFYNASVAPHITESTFKKFITSEEKFWCGVAVKQDKIIVFVTFVHNNYTWFEEGRIYLNDLFVSPEARVKGVGRKLIEYVYLELDKMGVPNVFWTTQFENHRAQILYSKMAKTGFAVYKRQL